MLPASPISKNMPELAWRNSIYIHACIWILAPMFLTACFNDIEHHCDMNMTTLVYMRTSRHVDAKCVQHWWWRPTYPTSSCEPPEGGGCAKEGGVRVKSSSTESIDLKGSRVKGVLPSCLILAPYTGNTLQHTATHCNTLQHTATHCNTLQHTATHCNKLQQTATNCNTLQDSTTHCNTLQHTAICCNKLQHTAIHRWWWWLFVSPLLEKQCSNLRLHKCESNKYSAWFRLHVFNTSFSQIATKVRYFKDAFYSAVYARTYIHATRIIGNFWRV